jgi:excisionase family DNA binding protein
VATKKSGEFYSFDEVLRLLNIDENRLKRLVSEGELGAVKDGGQMWFRKGQVDTMAGRRGGGDTAVPEIELVDEGTKAGKKDRLGEDLLHEPEAGGGKKGGMKTSEISSQDMPHTFSV